MISEIEISTISGKKKKIRGALQLVPHKTQTKLDYKRWSELVLHYILYMEKRLNWICMPIN